MADFFYNDAGRLRSVWRLAVFTAVYFVAMSALLLATEFGLALLLPRATFEWLLYRSGIALVIQSLILFVPAAVVGWGCAQILEDLPWRSLGWALHHGWVRDLLFGVLVGGAGVLLAALAGVAAGGYRVSLPETFSGPAVVRTLVVSGVIFMLGAAAEEILFRGYALQTLMRSWPIPLALIIGSIGFALVHMQNPHVVPGFTFVNTLLAGAWLAVAYWRTRSLWFPLGIHASWNWVQGAVLGSPVSGITSITPAPLLRFVDAGPVWVGGGAYGIEGGVACTLAIILATIFTARTRLLAATAEMKQYTDGENPDPQTPHVTPT